jgi:uncharacterized protein (DUF934 family)
MTEMMQGTQPRVWTPNGFLDADPWIHAEDAAALGETNAAVILPLATYLALDQTTRQSERARLGVLVAPGEAIEPLVPYLPDLALVALSFPAFNDGRSFSKAALLRVRHGFSGVLRATGDVLIDQVPHMLRLGFSELAVRNPVALRRLAEGRIGGIHQHYQPSAVTEQRSGTYSWRRVS